MADAPLDVAVLAALPPEDPDLAEQDAVAAPADGEPGDITDDEITEA